VNQTRPLQGKTALVTGASRGIGRAIALQLAHSGAHVIVHYGSAAAQAQALVAELQALGVQSAAIAADLSAHSAIAGLFHELDAILTRINGKPRFDILVNNAGVARFAPFDQLTEADFDLQFNVNVKALTFITQQALPRLNDGGRIINTSSAVTRANFFADAAAPYAASKGAVDVLTAYVAEIAAPRNITVNSVNPGVILTDMAAFAHSEEGAEMARSTQVLKRLGQPEDVARIVDFLAGPGGAWVTGQHIDASGGAKL
jgi:NAD(P)-dependent dehydrogenase (short-subunit alcohol dehydrogenase family)